MGTIEVVELGGGRGHECAGVSTNGNDRVDSNSLDACTCVLRSYFKGSPFFLGSFVEGMRIQLQVDGGWRLFVFLAKRDL